MDKRNLVAEAARRTGLTQTETHQALDAILATIAEALAAGDEVTLRNFGRFSVWHRRQTITNFDGTRHEIDTPRIAFSASPALRRCSCEEPCVDESA